MSTTLRLLGGVAAEYGGHTVQLALDRPVTMLIYLALRGDWVRRTELALLYKPDAADDEALSYLRKLIFRARRYDWVHDLEVEADYVRWQAHSDVAQFSSAADRGDHQQAVEIYHGPFLAGGTVPDAPGLAAWLDMERQALSATWFRVAGAWARQLGAMGKWTEAAELLANMVASDMLAEDVQQAYLQALVADGRRNEALAAFNRFRDYLKEEVGGVPLESTMLLGDSLLQQADGVHHERGRGAGLPETVTAFVGREAELEQLDRLLATDDARLVTIVGLGGSGKTRLAIEAARRWQNGGRPRAAFVSLSSVAEPGRLAVTLLDAMGLNRQEGPAEEALIRALKQTGMLLVLDGFEELLEAAPLLARILAEAPGIRLLVTSREPLKVSGEWRLDLGGLQIQESDPDHPGGSEAVQLFVQRAARTSSRFTATGGALAAIAGICRQLEGMPLAIELAAGWVRLLPVDELKRQLAGKSELLTSELQDIPERHRSIWRVFDHTWANLSRSEQQALVRLTVFRGSFSLPAAQAVAGADLSLLLGLLDRSLLRRRQEGRFVMHELIRQYSRSRATEEELAAATSAHSAYYCGELAALAPYLKGIDVQAGLDSVAVDSDNVEAAWLNATARLDLAALEQAREALDQYFYYRARLDSAIGTFGYTVTALRPLTGGSGQEQGPASRLVGLLQVHLAEKQYGLGDFGEADGRMDEALELLERWGTRLQLAHALLVHANGLVRMTRYQEARPLYERVLAAAEAEGDDYLQGAAHNGLANLLSFLEGDVQAAVLHYRASLVAHRRIGNLEGVTGALTNLGACSFDLHDLTGAERLWSEAVEVAARIGFREREAAILNNLGSLHEVRGEIEPAERSFVRSLELRRELGSRLGMANVLVNLGRLSMRNSDPGGAIGILAEANEIYSQLGDMSGEAHSRSYLSRALLQLGRRGEATVQLAQALKLAIQADSHIDILGALFTAAQLQESEGQHGQAVATARSVAAGARGSSESLRAEAESLVTRLNHSKESATRHVHVSVRDMADQLLKHLTAAG